MVEDGRTEGRHFGLSPERTRVTLPEAVWRSGHDLTRAAPVAEAGQIGKGGHHLGIRGTRL